MNVRSEVTRSAAFSQRAGRWSRGPLATDDEQRPGEPRSLIDRGSGGYGERRNGQPHVAGCEVDVNVEDRIAHLGGRVDSPAGPGEG